MRVHTYSPHYLYLLGLIFLGLGMSATCLASAIDDLSTFASEALVEKLGSTEQEPEIRFPSIKKLASNPSFAEVIKIKNVRLREERANGIASFDVACLVLSSSGTEKQITKLIHLPFEAWVMVPVASRRIFPNSRLKAEDFKIQLVNIATGSGREYRGILASPKTQFIKVQTKQTILEGQFLITSALQREPDVRRGEMVRLELISGDLSLTTQGIAQEPGAIGDRIHVLSAKTKKEVSGVVREDRTVEVKL